MRNIDELEIVIRRSGDRAVAGIPAIALYVTSDGTGPESQQAPPPSRLLEGITLFHSQGLIAGIVFMTAAVVGATLFANKLQTVGKEMIGPTGGVLGQN